MKINVTDVPVELRHLFEQLHRLEGHLPPLPGPISQAVMADRPVMLMLAGRVPLSQDEATALSAFHRRTRKKLVKATALGRDVYLTWAHPPQIIDDTHIDWTSGGAGTVSHPKSAVLKFIDMTEKVQGVL